MHMNSPFSRFRMRMFGNGDAIRGTKFDDVVVVVVVAAVIGWIRDGAAGTSEELGESGGDTEEMVGVVLSRAGLVLLVVAHGMTYGRGQEPWNILSASVMRTRDAKWLSEHTSRFLGFSTEMTRRVCSASFFSLVGLKMT